MKRAFAWLMVGLVGISSAGCSRVQTKIVQKPRVDQEITPGHNKGYLKGTPPAGGERRKTRDMIETNVELPTWQEMNPWRKKQQEQAAPGTAAAPAQMESAPSRGWEPAQQEEEFSMPPMREKEEVETSVPASSGGESYKVQKGDTLQKISQKYFGTTKNWYKIFNANKDMLKSPDRIRPGQTLMIPAMAKAAAAEDSSNEYK